MFAYPRNDRNRTAEKETYEQILSFAESVYGCHVIDHGDEHYLFVNRGGTLCNVYILADWDGVWFKEIDVFSTSENWGLGNSWDFQEACDAWYKEHTQRCPRCGEDNVDFERGVCNDCDAITFCPECQATLVVEDDDSPILKSVFQETTKTIKLGCCGEAIWIDSKSKVLMDDGTPYPLSYVLDWQNLDEATIEHYDDFSTFAEMMADKED